MVLVRMPSSIDLRSTHSCVRVQDNPERSCPEQRAVHELKFGDTCPCAPLGCKAQHPPISREYPDGYRDIDVAQHVLEGLAPRVRALVHVIPDAKDARIAKLEQELKAARKKKKTTR